MTSQVAINALIQLALMLAVVVIYVALARRFRALWHPLSIVAAVAGVSIIVAVLGELVFRGGWAATPAILRRSAIGGLGWGVTIAAVVWAGRKALASWRRPRNAERL